MNFVFNKTAKKHHEDRSAAPQTRKRRIRVLSTPPAVGKLRMTRHTPRRDRTRSGNVRGPPQRRSRHSFAPTVPICAATGGGIGRLAGSRARIRASAVATAAPASAPPALAGHAQIHGAAHVHQRRRNAQRNNNSFHRTSPCPPQRNNRRDGTDEGKSGCPGVILLRLPQSPFFRPEALHGRQ